MKVAIVLGTRPEIIKMAPVINESKRSRLDYFVLHSGQHYSVTMSRVFFEQLALSPPKYNIRVGFGTHAEETGKILVGVETILKKEQPDIVLVEGDTNTVLAGVLAAAKLRVKVGHVEAGLRSYDRSMPEEVNRVLTDHISTCLFAPTSTSRGNLLREGIEKQKIFVTGNTIVDAIHQNLKRAENRKIISDLGLEERNYLLLTLHRQENVDNPQRLRRILQGVELAAKKSRKPVVFPVHPRTQKRLKQYSLHIPRSEIRTINPVGYLEFLALEKQASLILTDSGGVQEEACTLRVPCVTLRENTERPETIYVGANLLASTSPKSIANKARLMMRRRRSWKNPFGDGKAAQRIVNVLLNKLSQV